MAPTLPQDVIEDLAGLGEVAVLIGGLPGNLTATATVTRMLQQYDNLKVDNILRHYLGVSKFGSWKNTLKLFAVLAPSLPTDSNYGFTLKSSATMMALTTAIVGLRLYARVYVTPKKLLPEDLACLIAMALAVATTAITITMLPDCGLHVWMLTRHQIIAIAKTLFIAEFFIPLTHLAIKMSFIICYYRLMLSPGFRKALLAFAILFTLYILQSFVGLALQCKPPQMDFWNHLVSAKCYNRKAAFGFGGVVFILADIFLMITPIWQVWKLNVKLKEKLLLVALFGSGSLITIAGTMRMIALWQWQETHDFTYALSKHTFWLLLEIDLSIVVSCAPAIRSLFTAGRISGAPSPVLSQLSISSPSTTTAFRQSSSTVESTTSRTKYSICNKWILKLMRLEVRELEAAHVRHSSRNTQ